jgi:hypothetical protein
MSLAAQDSADRVEQLIVLTERLTERLNAEIRAFEARRPQDAAARAEETGRLANLYRHESARVRADPSLLAGAPKPRREVLLEVTRTFEAMLARHGRALEAAKTITEGLVRAIATEVAANRPSGSGYGPSARAAKVDGSAITLNRRA